MASTSFSCSVNQGFNFEKDSQEVVGHLTSLKIGGKEFAKDIEVMDPTAIKDNTKIKVVGVLSGIFWNGGYADPLSFNCQVSTTNKQDSVVLQHSDLSDTNVEYGYVVYDYDPVEKVYYKAFHNDTTDLKGLVEKSGGELSLGIEMDQSLEVVSPKNYGLYVGIMPQEEAQTIHYGVSNTGKFTKAWGVTVAA
ncbi:hypothetical protein [Teredinibacter franksiae]|uniref:hypothetical protein n=1 Tax=Teredinibacter franksiae TaxID=2761453 RepID=UPI001629F682|nr:hypothetical protein [Teredinibacter franksiae]